jgi:L-alanine-DL-glutamate epimerase-like enolase superfamily enzyme
VKITGITVYELEYGLLGEKYSWSNGLFITSVTGMVVQVDTDEGISGFGEVCPLGPAYMEAFAAGVPAGVAELAPSIFGLDPRQLNKLNETMDLALGGHNYVKSPIDVACWDILGKASGQPIATLLGGRYRDAFPPYRAIPQRSPEEMAEDVLKFREKGYRRFQLKVGGEDVLVADANTGWIPREALRVVNAVRDLDVYIEQPCRTLEECLTVRRKTSLPFVLDEVIRGVEPLLDAHAQGAMDVVNLKISRLGGLTKAKACRDICQSIGIAMTLEDSWGGDIATAAIAHLAGSTREEFYLSSTDFNSYVDLSVAPDAPRMKNGLIPVPTGPGLGITVDLPRLGKPVLQLKA